jgi:predicted small lipoprotein YifL
MLAVLGAAAAGCGLKGPLTLPERGSGAVVIRGPAAPAAEAPPAESTPPEPAPDPTP